MDPTMLSSGDVSGFSLQASRSNGSATGDRLTLEGWNDGALVEAVSLLFAGINRWTTLALTQAVDEVRWIGTETGFHPFGVDDIRWNASVAVPEPLTLWQVLAGSLAAAIGGRRRR
jgi:hypothetical protein